MDADLDARPGLSIVIAAHNEACVIERTLGSILANAIDVPLQIVVVANGCTDDTAARARRMQVETGVRDIRIDVLDTPLGNKVHALNLGDRAARYFPRAYLDADCQLSSNLLQAVLRAFDDPGVRIVAPGVKYLYGGRNPVLRGYYTLWQSLPYVRRDTMARGFYAIDRTLRRRFEEFPRLTADDKFIRNLTTPAERCVVHEAHTTVHLPGTLAELLRVKTRWTYGNLELAMHRPDLNVNDEAQHEGAMRHVLLRPWLWAHMPTFLFVYWYSHRQARRRLQEHRSGWERAESSRSGVPVAGG